MRRAIATPTDTAVDRLRWAKDWGATVEEMENLFVLDRKSTKRVLRGDFLSTWTRVACRCWEASNQVAFVLTWSTRSKTGRATTGLSNAPIARVAGYCCRMELHRSHTGRLLTRACLLRIPPTADAELGIPYGSASNLARNSFLTSGWQISNQRYEARIYILPWSHTCRNTVG
jgi:hypothetical protein